MKDLIAALEAAGLPVQILEVPVPQATVTDEELEKRWKSSCRTAYRLMRESFEMPEPGDAILQVNDWAKEDDPAFCNILMLAYAQFLTTLWKEDPAGTKDRLIAALDHAVKSTGNTLWEIHDSCTKSSTKVDSLESPETSG